MGEHLPCKQGVKSSNLSVSIVSSFFWEQFRISDLYRYFANCIKKEAAHKEHLKIETINLIMISINRVLSFLVP